MFDLAKELLKFFTDTTKKLTDKMFLVIVVIVGLMLFDNIFGFSFYYGIDRKLSTIEHVEHTLKDSALNKDESTYLQNLRKNVIYHQSWKDRIWDYFKHPHFILVKSSDVTFVNFLYIFTGASFSLIFIVIGVYAFGYALYNKARGKNVLPMRDMAIRVLLIVIPSYGAAVIEIKLLDNIPELFGSLYFNCILNLLLNLGLLIAIVYIDKFFNKKKVAKPKGATLPTN